MPPIIIKSIPTLITNGKTEVIAAVEQMIRLYMTGLRGGGQKA